MMTASPQGEVRREEERRKRKIKKTDKGKQ